MYFVLPARAPKDPPTKANQSTAANTLVIAAQQRQAAENDKRRAECAATTDEKKREYAALSKAGKYWDAALAVRVCAEVLGSPDLRQLAKEAEIKSHVADINDPRTAPRDKARAMQMLIRDYPEVGAKYESQVQRLLAEADRQQVENEKKRRRSEGVHLGMSKDEVLASAWGKPQRINTTTNVFGTREQWVYGGRNYLYFENGVLVSIQN